MTVMLTLVLKAAEADHFTIDTTQTKPGKFETPVKITKPFIYRRNSMNKQAKQQKKIDPFVVPNGGDTYEITTVDCTVDGWRFQRLQNIHKGQSYTVLRVADIANGVAFLKVQPNCGGIHQQFLKDSPIVITLDRTKEYQKYTGLSHAQLRKITVGAGIELMDSLFGSTEAPN
ncbi:hypothetical protein PQQ86_15325 [Paraburkholderia sediminicola]|uniref:hypothetical protein n=1 Tax=Paraburkholderia sediminicola TaxID=458836 RepID=UPI0038B9E074